MRLHLVEKVRLMGPLGSLKIEAKVDTGAKRTSIDRTIANHLGLEPLREKRVKVKSGLSRRPKEREVAKARMELKGMVHKLYVGLENRSHMKYKVIIGMDIIKHYKLIFIPRDEIG